MKGRVKNRKKYRFDWLLNFNGAARDSKFCRGQAFVGKGQSWECHQRIFIVILIILAYIDIYPRSKIEASLAL